MKSRTVKFFKNRIYAGHETRPVDILMESIPTLQELAKRITNALMRTAFGEQAARLQLRDKNEKDLGGWCRDAVERVVLEELEREALRPGPGCGGGVGSEMETKHCIVGCEPVCTVCGLRKTPIGRSAPLVMANSLCDRDCEGYTQEPTPCDLWPGEARDGA